MFTKKIDDSLMIKQIEYTDAHQLFYVTEQSRSHLRKWLPWVDDTTTVEHTKNFIHSCEQLANESKGLNTVILYDDQIVGNAGFNQIDHINKITTIGYWLAENVQGKGIMTRVVQALTAYTFEELQFNKVEIRVAKENKKSRRIPERLGFLHEGCIRNSQYLHHTYMDIIIYGLLKDEWMSQNVN
ncbi:GNAT family N-acetyltransferase [Halalkalibacter sp. AB-rgal2]|uniref:GNAT family N-acetyltransferase n=1 Tax=Halalkalibacter sp. AB-rgal2 TaxID=3242695 RepID=UPI00359CC0EE